MSTQFMWIALITAIAGFLTIDLSLNWFSYRKKRGSTAAFGHFFQRWASQSKMKLSVMAGLAIVLALALALQGYTLVLPDIWGRLNLTRKMRWALNGALILAALVALDIFRSWRTYRTNSMSRSTGGVRFFRWWFKKSAIKLCIVCGVACFALGGAWVAQRYNLLHLKSESSGYMISARTYYKQKKYREATLELRNAIKQNKGDYEAYYWLGSSYLQLGNLAEARDAYREAIRIEPKLPGPHLGLGQIYFYMKDPDAAIKELEQALALVPKAPEPRMGLASIYLATGRGERAVEQYRAILANDPANLEVRKRLIDLLVNRRAFADAGREAETGLKQNPHDTQLQVLLAIARAGEGRKVEAETLLKEAAARDTASALPLITLGNLYARYREYPPALQSYEEAFKRSPDNVALMNNIAMLNVEHGNDLARAAELASRAYTRYPRDPVVLDTMGWVVFKQGKLAQALTLLRLAAGSAPQVPDVHYHYGAVLLKAGFTAAGRRELETALKISGDFDGAAQARSLLGGKAAPRS